MGGDIGVDPLLPARCSPQKLMLQVFLANVDQGADSYPRGSGTLTQSLSILGISGHSGLHLSAAFPAHMSGVLCIQGD
jgi:hypothetical protein